MRVLALGSCRIHDPLVVTHRLGQVEYLNRRFKSREPIYLQDIHEMIQFFRLAMGEIPMPAEIGPFAFYKGLRFDKRMPRVLRDAEALLVRDLPMIPTPNNNFLQIIQAPGYVAILFEMMHEVRLIPLNGRSHVNPKIRGYMGDSRGRWEGGTLVIDTTNFIGKGNVYGADEGLHLTERLTRTDPDTILYKFTVDDPTAFTRPWSGELPIRKSREEVFEYACHEGNYSVTNTLASARAAEKRAAGQEAEKSRK